jgi:hypothetical protein
MRIALCTFVALGAYAYDGTDSGLVRLDDRKSPTTEAVTRSRPNTLPYHTGHCEVIIRPTSFPTLTVEYALDSGEGDAPVICEPVEGQSTAQGQRVLEVKEEAGNSWYQLEFGTQYRIRIEGLKAGGSPVQEAYIMEAGASASTEVQIVVDDGDYTIASDGYTELDVMGRYDFTEERIILRAAREGRDVRIKFREQPSIQ